MDAGTRTSADGIKATHVSCEAQSAAQHVQENGGASSKTQDPALDAALRKVSRVLLPLLFLATLTNYLDRTALSFAALQLNADLGLSALDYGLAAGTFALGYGVGHIPFAYLAVKYGVRSVASGLTAAWGLVAMSAALVHNAAGLSVQRLLLGLAEAATMPCAIHLLAQFYPRSRLTQPATITSMGLTVSTMIAAPLAAGLMSIQAGGLRGWQWLFIMEGLPSVVLGVTMWFLLPNGPTQRAWMLSAEEQALVRDRVAAGQTLEGGGAAAAPLRSNRHANLAELMSLMADAARRPVLWFFTLAGFLWVLCVHSLNAFTPLIIKNMLAGTAAVASTSTGGNSALNTRNAALLSAIPYFFAALAMALLSWHSSRVNERTLHIGLSAIAGAVFWMCFGPMYAASFTAGFVSLVLTMALAYSQMGITYARVTEALDVRVSAIGIAIFNSVSAALGGFIGPYVTGAIVQRAGSFVAATKFQACFLLASGCMSTALGLWELSQRRRSAQLLGMTAKRLGDDEGGGDAAGASNAC